MLDPDALTIGFARRFATYKRATLSCATERLKTILNKRERPVQIVYRRQGASAGRMPGKALIQQIVQSRAQARVPAATGLPGRLRHGGGARLVQGVDVWLNTPLRRGSGRGTSGMKALANGVLNLSMLDGWWDEAWRKAEADELRVGWAID